MTNNERVQPRSAPGVGLVALLAAVGAAGLWLGQALGLLVGLLALAAALGGVWLYRARADRRLFAALDAYAQMELTRAARRRRTASRAGV
jgi:hypothetical protein